MTDTLTMPVSQAGYSVQFGSGIVATEVEGGPSRYMADNLRPSHRVQVQWNTDRKGYDFLADFYNRNIGQAFTIPLVIDDAALNPYKAFFDPESFRLTGLNGGTYSVQARLEVEFSGQTAFQQALGELRNAVGDDLPSILVCLHELVVEWDEIE